MKIASIHLGEYIAKLLATKPAVELYEVEEWGFYSINICVRDSCSTYFTTLEEAEQHFVKVVGLNKHLGEYNNLMKTACPTLSYRKEGCTLRKIKVSVENTITEVLAINTGIQLIIS